jgi:REP element-mobilizing transposase RayT
MRRVRITYPGAFHHAMNRGFDSNEIFPAKKTKAQFLNYLQEAAKKMKIRIFAYTVMDTHYHLVLENSSGRMSNCMKLLNGQYGRYYRKIAGGKGYVFQGRFKSTLIENDSYLIQSILYLLNNPVRAGLVEKAEDYIWSSMNCYFCNEESEIVDAAFIEELFGSKEELLCAVRSTVNRELTVEETKYGEFLGSEGFLESALKKHDRRTRPTSQSKGSQRIDEHYFDPVEKVLKEFEKMNGINIEEIDTGAFEGKRLRGDFLVLLKDKAGLTYKEIGEIELFENLSFSSLGSIYRNMKGRKFKNG